MRLSLLLLFCLYAFQVVFMMWVSKADILNIAGLYIYAIYFIEFMILGSLFYFLSFIKFGLLPKILFLVAIIIQLATYQFSYQYTSLLALENLDSLYIVFNIGFYKLLFASLICALILFIIWRIEPNYSRKNFKLRSLTVFAFAVVCLITFPLLKPSIVKTNIPRFLEQKPPISDFVSLLFENQTTTGIGRITDEDFIPAYIFKLDEDLKFPMVRDSIYTTPPPLIDLQKQENKPNVLVIFNEGISSRTLNHNSNLFPGLSPNISKFVTERYSTTFQNYYGHTAATYRGLLGQLCSTFSGNLPNNAWRTGNDFKFFCLMDQFENLTYKTEFIYPHLRQNDFIADMLEKIGFDSVLAGEELSAKYLPNFKGKHRNNSLSNEQLFKLLIEYYSNLDTQTPTFTAVYPYETHAYFDTAEDGVKYSDGENHVLNTIHDLDIQFGKFWEKFKQSPQYDNTIVIFTADHSRFPEPAYVEALQQAKASGYDYHFIDFIPFIVHYKGSNLPPTYDANYASSLDFAPTISHMLGLGNKKNSFLGSTIFERKHNASIGSMENLFFKMDKDGVKHITEFEDSESLAIKYQIKRVHDLVLQDRVWPR